MTKVLNYISCFILIWGCTFFFRSNAQVAAEKQPESRSFSVYVNGRTTSYTSTQNTVEGALKEKGISFHKNRVFPQATAQLVDGARIFLLKRGEKFEFKECVIAQIPIEYVNEPTLEYGATKVIQKGRPGLDKVIYKIDVNGIQKEIGHIHIAVPEKSIIQKGTKNCIMTERGLKHYKRKFVANVSAYTIEDGNGDGVTSIGIIPYEGIVAVDPDFIPYRSKLYIPGYGLAMAGDTGGAIIGNCIDLFMYDRDRAWQWGRRFIEVYVLDD